MWQLKKRRGSSTVSPQGFTSLVLLIKWGWPLFHLCKGYYYFHTGVEASGSPVSLFVGQQFLGVGSQYLETTPLGEGEETSSPFRSISKSEPESPGLFSECSHVCPGSSWLCLTWALRWIQTLMNIVCQHSVPLALLPPTQVSSGHHPKVEREANSHSSHKPTHQSIQLTVIHIWTNHY